MISDEKEDFHTEEIVIFNPVCQDQQLFMCMDFGM